MQISVCGLWHLGSVTSILLSSLNHYVLAFDANQKLIKDFDDQILPVSEPGLIEILSKSLNDSKIEFISEINQAFINSDIFWITYDTPVDANDVADIDYVINEIHKILSRKWYQENKELRKNYYEENKEYISERNKKWYENTKDKRKETKKIYRQARKEKENEVQKIYRYKEYICFCGWIGTNGSKYNHFKKCNQKIEV